MKGIGLKKVVFTEKAPKPIGPYSQAIVANGFIFVSGQIPIDPKTGEVVKGGVKEQTRRVIENIKAILEACGATLNDVVYVIVFLRDLKYYKEFNEEYARHFQKEPPARVTVGVHQLPGDVLLEMSVIACKES